MPTIRIDDEVYLWLQGQAKPFEDTPNTVLRRIAGLDIAVKHGGIKMTNSSVNTLPRPSLKTHQSAFREPILKILKKHGGRADRMTVLKELELVLEGKLTEYDKSDISSGTIRWQKSAEWEVRVMREEQLLEPVSKAPRGTWALTAKGHKEAESF